MNAIHLLGTRLAALLLACAAAFAGTAARAEAPPWPESPFSYMGKEQQLEKVLAGFAKAFGIELRMENELPPGLAAPSGRSVAATPTEFLNQIGAAYNLTWYYHAGVLYVSRTGDRVTRMIPTKGMPAAALKRTFTEMGLLNPRFGWGDVDQRSAIMVWGPRSYVERIEAAITAFPDPKADQQVLVFRLKHASVDDRTIQYRDKQIVTPGVATMLRNLLGGIAAQGSGASFMEVTDATRPMQPLKPLVAETERADPPGARAARPQEAAPSRAAAVIQADSRLNAIVIKDTPQNAPIYRELIDLLDVPSNLVEIEAAIVDVNTSSLSELGVDWSGRTGRVAGNFGDPTAATSLPNITIGRGASTVIPNATDFLLARLKLLETKGNARIVSRPFILTQDNMGALIDLSDTFYVQTTGERVATVTPISVGVTLRVTPHIVQTAAGRSVQLVVDIEDGSIQDIKIGALPTVRRSVIGTQAVVGENESLLIGGFNTEQNMKNKEQVPVLGDVPVLGLAFSRSTNNTEKSERMFLITPKIVGDRLAQAAARANEIRP